MAGKQRSIWRGLCALLPEVNSATVPLPASSPNCSTTGGEKMNARHLTWPRLGAFAAGLLLDIAAVSGLAQA
jgi:hypothetical protein